MVVLMNGKTVQVVSLTFQMNWSLTVDVGLLFEQLALHFVLMQFCHLEKWFISFLVDFFRYSAL